MSVRAVISDRAEADISAAHDWWAQHRSAEQAGRWFKEIHDAVDAIGVDPHRYPLAAESSKFPFEVREKLFGLGRRPTHRILFAIKPDFVFILVVRHVAQDAIGPEDT